MTNLQISQLTSIALIAQLDLELAIQNKRAKDDALLAQVLARKPSKPTIRPTLRPQQLAASLSANVAAQNARQARRDGGRITLTVDRGHTTVSFLGVAKLKDASAQIKTSDPNRIAAIAGLYEKMFPLARVIVQ